MSSDNIDIYLCPYCRKGFHESDEATAHIKKRHKSKLTGVWHGLDSHSSGSPNFSWPCSWMYEQR